VARRATVSEVTHRYFTCRTCGARGEVEFRAHGDSIWQSGSLLLEAEPETAGDVAHDEDLMKDASRVLGLVTCPTCKQRDARYVRWSRIRVAAWLGIGGVLLAIGGMHATLIAIVFGLLGGYQAHVEHGRFRRADNARILRLSPGVRPALPEPALSPVLPPTPNLPRARAITAPPIQPIAPRGPDEEPAFLRTSDK
jgi:hypothetical protein